MSFGKAIVKYINRVKTMGIDKGIIMHIFVL